MKKNYFDIHKPPIRFLWTTVAECVCKGPGVRVNWYQGGKGIIVVCTDQLLNLWWLCWNATSRWQICDIFTSTKQIHYYSTILMYKRYFNQCVLIHLQVSTTNRHTHTHIQVNICVYSHVVISVSLGYRCFPFIAESPHDNSYIHSNSYIILFPTHSFIPWSSTQNLLKQ